MVGLNDRKVNYILDADIQAFLDAVDQDWLIRFLNHRLGDQRIIRLIQKWLKAGLVQDGVVTVSEKGKGQGSVASPLLANVYLHYVFDLWAARWTRQKAKGDMIIIRYADDIVVGFQYENDARRFREEMRAIVKVCAVVASGKDPPDRAWPLRSGSARFGRALPLDGSCLCGLAQARINGTATSTVHAGRCTAESCCRMHDKIDNGRSTNQYARPSNVPLSIPDGPMSCRQ
jgi:hypothetical protein